MSENSNDGRGIVFSGDALRHARKIENAMTQQQLATAAGVDVATIRRAEKERGIDPAYAHAIATKLGHTIEELRKKSLPKVPPAPSDESVHTVTISHATDGTVTIVIRVNKSYKPPAEYYALRFMELLDGFVTFLDGYKKEEVTGAIGSLIITVPLSRRDAAKLIDVFIQGKLNGLAIASITINSKNGGAAADDLPFRMMKAFGRALIADMDSLADSPENTVERSIARLMVLGYGFNEIMTVLAMPRELLADHLQLLSYSLTGLGPPHFFVGEQYEVESYYKKPPNRISDRRKSSKHSKRR